ncbi:MAG: cobaltochelatase subunit CobN, partial [Gemmatimonadaceae bacterium]|nr:cobaltochelatase subunit CobN [Gloeobacterales cyanobacterium ES-bin-141]
MHRIATAPGDWQPGETGTVLVEQTPAPIVFLTAADTELQALAAAVSSLPPDFAAVRGVNLLRLQQQVVIDQYAETVLSHARAIVLRVLGGRAYWSYGLEVVTELARSRGIALVVLPGDEQVDLELIEHSTVPLTLAGLLWQYCKAGGAVNLGRALQVLSDSCFSSNYRPGSPIETPRTGLYETTEVDPHRPTVGILFYRAHLLSANTGVIDALATALHAKGLNARCVYAYSPKEPESLTILGKYFQGIDCLINTTSFSLARLDADEPDLSFWEALDVPVLQAVLSSDTEERWAADNRGLSPRDVAMNVALPEVDGRIISRAISFKRADHDNPAIESPIVTYHPQPDRIDFVAELACRWVRLRRTPQAERRIALVLANYPNRDGRLANGVGLDTPASCVAVLKALAEAGYDTGESLPKDGDALIKLLTGTVTNDVEGFDYRPLLQWVEETEYAQFFETLPASVQTSVSERWGPPPGSLRLRPEGLPVSGVRLGNVFVAIQPARGYDSDPALNYHAPDLQPPHPYFAFYYWLRTVLRADAVIHLGKHG